MEAVVSAKENEIINRHLSAMLDELIKAGITAEAALVFVAIEPWDYNITIHAAGRGEKIEKEVGEDRFAHMVMQHAHDQICDVLDGNVGERKQPS